ncbi:MAG TPA: urate oxidase [Chloroflexota bacterium]|nr:urate oxidase [Chloroflexota bacterium]
MSSNGSPYRISYGKAQIPLYRVYATPLAGLTPVPESGFVGRANTVLALRVDVEVFGDNFLPAYTQGDNSSVVATDSMKSFVLAQALAYDGSTLEGFLDFLGRRFLATYPQMQALRLAAREQPFTAARVPQRGGDFADSAVLFSPSHGDHAFASLECERDGATGEYRLAAHTCGRRGMQLMKIAGSSFTRFVRDRHTTLPERVDRPLFIYLDVHWTYADPSAMLAADLSRYIAAEQVRDVVQAVFDSFVSESIQHLVNEMGQRLLSRFPQMATVSFDAQNHTWDPVVESETDPRVKVYTDPFPAHGIIRLMLSRVDG